MVSFKPRVCVLTGTRAEYGLLKPLLKGLAQDPALTLQLLVTGSHLVPEFGATWREIVADGFAIDEQVDIVVSTDSRVGVCKSMGLAMMGFGDALDRLRPDMLVLLGDRYEALCAATAANVLNIPVAHLHGGEVTEGAIDDAMRHAITKLSHLHFTSTAAYRQRVIQMGEAAEHVFDVGAIGLDSICKLVPLDCAELSASIGFDLAPAFWLMTYHPETLGDGDGAAEVAALISAVLASGREKLLITGANADAGGRAINQALAHARDGAPERVCVVASLGQQRYLSAMRLSLGVVGNSSSGIIEAPSMKVPTINVGRRQHGRLRAASVIDVPLQPPAIAAALQRCRNAEERATLLREPNPYGDGHTAERVLKHLGAALHGQRPLFHKSFHDIPASPSSSLGIRHGHQTHHSSSAHAEGGAEAP